MRGDTPLKQAFEMVKRHWLLIAVLLAVLCAGLYTTKPWAVDYARFEPTDETFNVEVSGYYGYRGKRIEFSHVIECRKVIIRDLDDWGGEDWKPNTQIFTAGLPDGSTLLYGFWPTDNDPKTLGVADFHCGMFIGDPLQVVERQVHLVWIDDISNPRRVFESQPLKQLHPIDIGVISPGRIAAKRTKRQDLTPVDPMIHWAYPMMGYYFTGALAFAHKEHNKREAILSGYAVSCIDREPLRKNWESRNLQPGYQAVPADFVTKLCAEIAANARRFLPLVPKGEAPERVVVGSSNPDLWAFYADPELTRALFRGDTTVDLVYKTWTITVRHTQQFNGNLCPESGDSCIVFNRRYLRVSRSAAARFKREK